MQAQSLGAFHKDAGWHVAFHGTRVESLKGILSANALAKPGDEVVVGKDETMKLSIREDTGRIRREQRRENRHTRRAELFDPNQVFMSPTVRYCERSGYAKPTRWQDPEDTVENLEIQYVRKCCHVISILTYCITCIWERRGQ